jgi:hypothetical protein
MPVEVGSNAWTCSQRLTEHVLVLKDTGWSGFVMDSSEHSLAVLWECPP